MCKIFDTHCHLVDFPLNDLDSFKGLLPSLTVLTVSKSPDDWRATLDLAATSSFIYPAIGIHPWFVDLIDLDASLHALEKLVRARSDVAAIGEVGLDFVDEYIHCKSEQLEAFIFQAELAKQEDLVLSIHCRKGFDEILDILRKEDLSRAIMHGFSGSYEQSKSFVDKGYKIGIGPQLLNRKSVKYERLVHSLPIECLVIETDAPYGRQGLELNHFERLSALVKRIAEIKSLSIDEVQAVTYTSAQSVIGCK